MRKTAGREKKFFSVPRFMREEGEKGRVAGK
jgi:hypothetical protein